MPVRTLYVIVQSMANSREILRHFKLPIDMEIQTLEIKKHFVYAEHHYCAYIDLASDGEAWFVIFDADEYGNAIDQPIYSYTVSSVTDDELNKCIQEFINN